MKPYLLTITLLSLCCHIQGQTIEGTIYDAKTREVLPNVVIYLHGTAIQTVSGSDGHFSLVTESKINTALVISHVSYESLVIDHPFDHPEQAFYLKEKVNILPEAVVVSDRFSRAQKMTIFKEQFLGEGRGGKSCLILNEEDIFLSFDHQTNRLMGFARNPIIIENKYLAYIITFDLQSFTIQYTQNSLDNRYLNRFSIVGTYTLFDQSPNDRIIKNRRNEIYRYSRQFFWKNFIANTLKDAKFKIYNHGKQMEPSQYFIVTDSLTCNLVQIKPGTDINLISDKLTDSDLFGVITVSSGNRFLSEVIFHVDHFSLDPFGNIDLPGSVFFAGAMAQQRIGEVLPMDFSYAP